MRRLDAAVEIDRRDQRLVAVGDDGALPAAAGLLFAATEDQELPEVSASPSRASDAADTSDAFSFDLCPSLCCGNSRNSMSAMTKPSTESPRNSIDSLSNTPPLASSCDARPVRQRVLEQPAVAEAVSDRALERFELRPERDDPSTLHLVAVALDDPQRRGGIVGVDRDPPLPRLVVQRQRERGPRVVAEDRGKDAVGLEQTLDHVGLDFRRRPKDDDEIVQGLRAHFRS